MPMVDLTLPTGRSDRDDQEALAAEPTRLITHWESGTDRPDYDKASWAFVRELDLTQSVDGLGVPAAARATGSWSAFPRARSTKGGTAA